MRMSKSKINTYLKCPLEFKFQYIDKIEAEPNKYMILGSDVHLIAEKFADKFGDELEGVNIENELIKIMNELDIGYDLSSHVNNLGLFFREVFIENNYKLFSQEEYLHDEVHRFSGICDIILEDENGELVVIDYKTSNSNTFSRYRRELCYYKLLVETKTEVEFVDMAVRKHSQYFYTASLTKTSFCKQNPQIITITQVVLLTALFSGRGL